jgi:hypothetical protein
MVLQRKRSLFVGLGLAMTIGVVVALPATASAVSTLTGETLRGSGSGGAPLGCATGGFNVVGGGLGVTGPYPGTFTETAAWTLDPDAFNATFTITSGTTTITGSKSGSNFNIGCGVPTTWGASIPYTATIHTPGGDFHDEGTATVSGFAELGHAQLTETFTSSLAHASPTSKDQCKNGGWKALPQFKNQGQCVSFVERQPQT